MRYAALLAALVVLLSVVAGPAAALTGSGSVPAPATAEPTPPSRLAPAGPAATVVGTPRTNFSISLRADSAAEWTVETTIPLSDETDRAAFREYASEYESGDASGGPSIDLFRNAAAQASEATGREMAISNVNRSTVLRNQTGTLRLQFTWEGFLAQGENGTLVLGDAFETPNNGTWLGSLSDTQRLVIVPPEGYEVSDVSDGFRRSINDRRIIVEGPQTFEAGDIEIAYASTEGGLNLPVAWIVGGGAVLLVAVAAIAYRRGGLRAADVVVPNVTVGDGEGDAGAAANANSTAGDASADAAAGVSEHVPGGKATPDAGTGAAATDADGAIAGEATAVADDGHDATEDLELLSDEERVERLLEQNGGRMRQGDIVSGTGWSDAKVSQLLSAMADDGRIEKLRLGRENLISLADESADDGDDESTA
ncbi:helix-turn-helix transcriptional regulator [Halobaculum marinum]|uniref:Helix-turn-helix transcriptional regulator n=1 Tax=Halobaculum marinum TaxID=3031996 RepID=A0ABD5WWS8_9EURY|nr:hypothetical protein [Halobaculum sp. DT55]